MLGYVICRDCGAPIPVFGPDRCLRCIPTPTTQRRVRKKKAA